jgi:hypothetical protein
MYQIRHAAAPAVIRPSRARKRREAPIKRERYQWALRRIGLRNRFA